MTRNLQTRTKSTALGWLSTLLVCAGCNGSGDSAATVSNQHGDPSSSTPGASAPASSLPSPAPVALEPTGTNEAHEPGEQTDLPVTDPTTAPTTTLAPQVPTAPPQLLDAGAPAPTTPAATPTLAPIDAGAPEEEEGWQLDWMDDPLENPATCPAEEPAVGDPCPSYELVCKYGETSNCRSRWVCGQDDTWYMQYAKRDCPDVCPTDEPTEGDPCTSDKAQCTYGANPTCRSQWMCFESQWTSTFPARECAAENNCPAEPPRVGIDCDPAAYQNGCVYETAYWCSCSCVWDEEAMASGVPTTRWYCNTIDSSLPPDYLTSCPQQVPSAGSACDSGSTCGYQTLDECNGPGEGTTLAQCIDGAWSIEGPPVVP